MLALQHIHSAQAVTHLRHVDEVTQVRNWLEAVLERIVLCHHQCSRCAIREEGGVASCGEYALLDFITHNSAHQ